MLADPVVTHVRVQNRFSYVAENAAHPFVIGNPVQI